MSCTCRCAELSSIDYIGDSDLGRGSPKGSAPAPKTVAEISRKSPIFTAFCSSEMRLAC
jgi:hypothetical protein